MKDNADDYINSGNAYYAKGQLDLAIQDYSQAIEVDPKCAVAYTNRGLAYKAIGQANLAQMDFNKAMELDQKLAELKRSQSSTATPSSYPSSGASLESQNILGIMVADLGPTEKHLASSGVVVKSIFPDSPCKDILKLGNIITGINPQGKVPSSADAALPFLISDINDFRKQVAKITPFTSV